MSNPVSNPRSGLGWAVLGSLLGGAASLAANIGQTLIRPDNIAPEDWHVDGWNFGIGVSAPLFLFIALEILIKPHWWMAHRSARLFAYIGFTPVAAGAGLVSFLHLYALLAYKGQPTWACVLLSFVPDGMMLMSTVAQRFIRRLSYDTSTSAATPAPTGLAVEPSTPDRTPTVEPAPAPVAPAVVAAPPVATSREVTPNRLRNARATTSTDHDSNRSATEPDAPSRTDISVTARTRATQLELPIDNGLVARAMKFASEHRAKTGKPITPRELSYRLRIPLPRAAALLDQAEFTDPKPIARVNGSPAV